MLVLADLPGGVNDIIGAVVGWLGQLSVLDWILVGIGVALAGGGWIRAVAYSRLGTIGIDDFASDKVEAIEPAACKAMLQEKLGERGWLPSSGVPSGSPTADKLADAISESPVPQGKWLGTLVKLLPFLPTSVSFRVTGTLKQSAEPGDTKPYALHYELVCLGPRQDLRLDQVADSSWPKVMEAASKAIYLGITELAPGIYPDWARWTNVDALTMYRTGLNIESGARRRALDDRAAVQVTYSLAEACYREASRLDPQNMLSRLRAANCAERIVLEANSDDVIGKRIAALGDYLAIRLREPALFSAGYRASVLLSLLADSEGFATVHFTRLNALLDRLEQDTARHVDVTDAGDRSLLGRMVDALRRSGEHAVVSLEESALQSRLTQAARHESEQVRKRLGPFWVMTNERRFRHRYEPRGQERRQLQKALGISRLCMLARRAARKAPRRPTATQFFWRGWLFWWYMFGRWHRAGWQAHYNAACFYALLPQAASPKGPFGSTGLRRRALKHLERAIDQADGALPCRYVRDEDPDLNILRQKSKVRFDRAIRKLCPRELTVRYRGPDALSGMAVVSGDGSTAPPGSFTVVSHVPGSLTGSGADYRVTVLDENRPLVFRHNVEGTADGQEWELIASELPSEIWLVHGNPNVFQQEPPTVDPV